MAWQGVVVVAGWAGWLTGRLTGETVQQDETG